MSRLVNVRQVYVEYVPAQLEPGVLYISKRFRTASHLCCCGCGRKVVTPLNPAKWSLTDHGASVSLSPSVGNWGYPCRSHYLIIRNKVRWLGHFNERQIAAAQRRDRIDVERIATDGDGLLAAVAGVFKRWFR